MGNIGHRPLGCHKAGTLSNGILVAFYFSKRRAGKSKSRIGLIEEHYLLLGDHHRRGCPRRSKPFQVLDSIWRLEHKIQLTLSQKLLCSDLKML